MPAAPRDLSTACVRAGQPRQDAYDAVTTPISCTSTYAFGSSAELRDHFEGRTNREEYGRYGNPTVRAAEEKLAALDGGGDACLFASGMAAVTTTLFALLKKGDHVVLTSDCYRRTRSFVQNFLARYGVEASLVPAGDLAALEAEVRPETRVIVTESPTNPYLRVADIEGIAAIKKKFPKVKVLVDSTFATPINQRPLEQGADLVIHSATKYLGGHNDLLAGVVTGDAGLVSVVRDLRGVLGGVLDPHAAYLLIRGIKTLALRVERQNRTALAVAQFLEAHPAVERVFYPGLPSHPDHELASKTMSGFGGVISFVLRTSLEGTARALDACQLATVAPSLGGVETLIEQPALMSFYELTPQERAAIGIRESLVRLAVGIEDEKDIVADLERVLATVSQATKKEVFDAALS
ncbi:Cystathionine gamma-synthase [Labilithrix luteola]|uniref:Cystathionine gamma-synthase n=1 Tax=Labilithrix luteola TaxID=1391654 RepID=A0A0K1PL77_9BACT|nr:aminotransferase class I/II-fold pyridoxal phosphate-dependent enzyme [Labilithrix luteola]AKU94161.1 Cystathionine gamma-synthase [Labilithrix luteola]